MKELAWLAASRSVSLSPGNRDALFFMAEDLDDFLAFHHFFNIAVDGTEILLLLSEILTGATGKLGDWQGA